MDSGDGCQFSVRVLSAQDGRAPDRLFRLGLAPCDATDCGPSLRVGGIQCNTQVTLQDCAHELCQVYYSALSVAYASHPPELWESFARLVLEAAHEATLCATVLNRCRSGNNALFLTLMGGGCVRE